MPLTIKGFLSENLIFRLIHEYFRLVWKSFGGFNKSKFINYFAEVKILDVEGCLWCFYVKYVLIGDKLCRPLNSKESLRSYHQIKNFFFYPNVAKAWKFGVQSLNFWPSYAEILKPSFLLP